tara:strand:- start:10587 stop:10808 length:222 start_codon:yes stop_codon:yes gene_type:complete
VKRLEIKDGEMPPNGIANALGEYRRVAREMQVGQYVVTADKKTTAGVIRALNRLDRSGKQRTIDGKLHVWRVE